MILDAQLLLSDSTALTVTANSANVVDLISTADISRSYVGFRARAQVDVTFTAAGAATLQTQLVTSAAAALTSPTILFDTGAVAKATLVAGYIVMDVVIPQTTQRFLGIIYTVATGPMTAGNITAALVSSTETPIPNRIVGNVSFT